MPDFLDQFRAEMVRVLPTRSTREKDAFAALSVVDQTWRYLNWQSRLVHPHPRQVNVADGFDALPAVRANRTAVDVLLGKIARGDDVRGHLSKDVERGYCLHPAGRKNGPDFDLMLNEWGIHHLHLNVSPGEGFKPRTSDLLYVIFGRAVAFVLAVAPRGAWTSTELIAAVDRSWPHQGLFVALNSKPGKAWTEDEHKALRSRGLTVVAAHGGRSWFSGMTLGLTTALGSVRLMTETGHILKRLYNAADHEEELVGALRQNADLNGVQWPAVPKVSVKVVSAPDRYCFAFVEEHSQATLMVVPPWATTIARWDGESPVPSTMQ